MFSPTAAESKPRMKLVVTEKIPDGCLVAYMK